MDYVIFENTDRRTNVIIRGKEIVALDLEETKKSIGKRIRELNLTKEELKLLNWDSSRVSKWKNAKNLITLPDFFVLCQMLNIRVEDLIVTTHDKKILIERYEISNIKWLFKYFEKCLVILFVDFKSRDKVFPQI